MMERFIDRIDNMATRGRGGFWTCMALFFAAAVGFQLAAFKFGHGDVAQLTIVTAMLLVGVFYLVKQRPLRVLLLIAAMTLLIVGLMMLALQSPHAK